MKLKDIKQHFSVFSHDNGTYLLFKNSSYTGTITYNAKTETVALKSPVYADEVIMPKHCTIDNLFDAIEYIKKALPFPLECYNPTFRESWRIETCLYHYLTNIGFVHSPGGYGNNVYKLTNSNAFGVNCDITIIITANNTLSSDDIGGNISMYLSPTKSLSYEFTNLDSAIKTINGLMMTALSVSMSTMVQWSESFLNREINLDNVELKEIDKNMPFNVYTTKMKEHTINMLEEILSQLKNDK